MYVMQIVYIIYFKIEICVSSGSSCDIGSMLQLLQKYWLQVVGIDPNLFKEPMTIAHVQ
jgi:hypothetical protein